jgi:outer membrane protein assembly factor BamD (BamD/ComL family)
MTGKKIFSLLLALSCALLSPAIQARADEKSLMDCSRHYYLKGEYYNAITEIMRYQCLYPAGTMLPEALLLKGKASYRGDDYSGAIQSLENCYARYQGTPAGEEALYLTGIIQMSGDSAIFAIGTFSMYLDRYGDSMFAEKVRLNQCYAHLLAGEYRKARQRMEEYRKKYPAGDYLLEVDRLAADLDQEESRPEKSLAVAALGSMVLPGFGFFYTGNYATGVFSLLSNACFISLMVDVILIGNMFQWMLFGFLEFSFYQYSVIGGMRSVNEYNRGQDFRKSVRLRIEQRF